MEDWKVVYIINFTSDGDTTAQAFYKHIQEIERMYGLLNILKENTQGGANIEIKGAVDDVSKLPATAAVGDVWAAGEELYVWDGQKWQNMPGLSVGLATTERAGISKLGTLAGVNSDTPSPNAVITEEVLSAKVDEIDITIGAYLATGLQVLEAVAGETTFTIDAPLVAVEETLQVDSRIKVNDKVLEVEGLAADNETTVVTINAASLTNADNGAEIALRVAYITMPEMDGRTYQDSGLTVASVEGAENFTASEDAAALAGKRVKINEKVAVASSVSGMEVTLDTAVLAAADAGAVVAVEVPYVGIPEINPATTTEYGTAILGTDAGVKSSMPSEEAVVTEAVAKRNLASLGSDGLVLSSQLPEMKGKYSKWALALALSSFTPYPSATVSVPTALSIIVPLANRRGILLLSGSATASYSCGIAEFGNNVWASQSAAAYQNKRGYVKAGQATVLLGADGIASTVQSDNTLGGSVNLGIGALTWGFTDNFSRTFIFGTSGSVVTMAQITTNPSVINSHPVQPGYSSITIYNGAFSQEVNRAVLLANSNFNNNGARGANLSYAGIDGGFGVCTFDYAESKPDGVKRLFWHPVLRKFFAIFDNLRIAYSDDGIVFSQWPALNLASGSNVGDGGFPSVPISYNYAADYYMISDSVGCVVITIGGYVYITFDMLTLYAYPTPFSVVTDLKFIDKIGCFMTIGTANAQTPKCFLSPGVFDVDLLGDI